MIHQATEAIYEALKNADEDLKVFIEENGDASEAWLQFVVRNGSGYRIRYISEDEDNDVSVRVYGLINLKDQEYCDKIIPVLNKINNKFRYVKFFLDKDGDVNVTYDYPLDNSNPAGSAFEMMVRFVKIINEAYPMMMRAMWGEEKELDLDDFRKLFSFNDTDDDSDDDDSDADDSEEVYPEKKEGFFPFPGLLDDFDDKPGDEDADDEDEDDEDADDEEPDKE